MRMLHYKILRVLIYELQGSVSSVHASANPLKTPAALQLKSGPKNFRPAVHSAPVPISQECEPSPLTPHFNPNPFAIPYTPQLVTTMSLPPSSFYLDYPHDKHLDEHPTSFSQPPSLTSPQRIYISSFPFAGTH